MKINYKGYYLFKENGSNSEFNATEGNKSEYNPQIVKRLTDNREYERLATYLERYHFNDDEEERKHLERIRTIREEGSLLQHQYTELKRKDPNAFKRTELYEALQEDGGFEKLDLNENQYARRFHRVLSNLVDLSQHPHAKRIQDPKQTTANYLSYTFKRGKRKLFNADILDFVLRDNENTYDNFLKTSGITEEELNDSNNGTRVITKDGETTIFVPVNSKLNFKIAEHSKDNMNGPAANFSTIECNALTYDFENNKIINKENKNQDLEKLHYKINRAKRDKENAFNTIVGEKQYSSTIGGYIDDGLEELKRQYNTGEIDLKTYNAMSKEHNNYINEIIHALGYAQYEIYSNKYNDKSTDKLMHEMDNIQKTELGDIIKAMKSNQVHLTAMVSNGKIGTQISIDPIYDSKQKEISKAFDVFIPGLFMDRAQEILDKDSKSRACIQLNKLQDYGHKYKTTNGNELQHLNNGIFKYNDETISKDKALEIMYEDLTYRDAEAELIHQYSKHNGEIAEDLYTELSKKIAVKAMNEIIPNIQLATMNGTPLDIETIFNHKGNGDVPDYELEDLINASTYNKIERIFQFYSRLINKLNMYR